MDGVDALRAVAAIAVLIFHYEALAAWTAPSSWPPLSLIWTAYGLLGVEFFFVISGAVIALSLEHSRSLWVFAIRRVARLYPAYWLSVAISGTFLFSINAAPLWYILVNLTMIQNFIGISQLIPPYWTLAYELWFYVLLGMISAIGAIRFVPALGLLWLATMAICRLGNVTFSNVQNILLMPLFGQFFLAGIMLYRLAKGCRDTLTISCLLACLFYSLLGRKDWASIPGPHYFVATCLFAIAVLAALNDRLPTPKWLSEIGKMSYSIYLLHLPIGMIIASLSDWMGISRWIGISIAVPATIALSMASYKLIELPAQYWAKSFPSRRPAIAD